VVAKFGMHIHTFPRRVKQELSPVQDVAERIEKNENAFLP